jgi:translation initiation factor IF-2
MMVRKRVHELAKDLGLDNKEVIQALQSAGISVKTHSSSVYEEEARAVLNKLKGPAPAPAPRRPGMVILRKRRSAEDDAATADIGQSAVAEGGAESQPADAKPPADAQQAASQSAEEAALSKPPEVKESALESHDVSQPASTPEPAVTHLVESPATASGEAAHAVEPATGAAPVETSAPLPSEAETIQPQEPAPSQTVAAGDGRAASEAASTVTVEPSPDAPAGPPAEARARAAAGGKPATKPAGSQGAAQRQKDRGGQPAAGKAADAQPKKGKPGAPGAGRPPARKGRTPTKREMVEMRERTMHPSRLRKKKTAKRPARKTEVTQPKASKRVIKMKETIVITDLAHQLGVKAGDVLRKLMSLGLMISQNEAIELETAQLVAADYEYTVESVAFAEEAIIDAPPETEDQAKLKPRPPVVTVMGHVDHGKTSILDHIRKAHVASGEAGGITQHIGAYSVTVPNRGAVTFLDTPGHAAFTSMRARGAQVTDIVVLVVAADDGVMPQTEEAVRHAQDAGVPIIVAVNKMDRPDASPERVTQELTKFELVPEDWGGETLYVQTSATAGTGIKELVEAILLQAEVLELKANPDRAAAGTVVEAKLDKGRGPVATILVQQGTLHRGDAVVVGEFAGKIRAMCDETGRQLQTAGPSVPVEITGLDGVPDAGDQLFAVDTADAAREVATHRQDAKRAREQSPTGARMTLDDLMKRMNGEEAVELKIVLKADVQGSVEAVKASVEKLSTDEVKVNVIYGGVGAIKESDITLASASGGLVVGFNVRPDPNSRVVSEREGVEIRTYNVIYDLVDDVRKAMEGLLTPESREKVLGRAEVREVFKISKVGAVAGCRVIDGKAMRAAKVRVLRDSVLVYDGKVGSLKHFKNDVREVDSGLECGASVDGFNDIKSGDVLEFYQIEEVARTLGDSASPGAGKRSSSPGRHEAHP